MMVFPLNGFSGRALGSSDLLHAGLVPDIPGSDFFLFLLDSADSDSVSESFPAAVDESRVRFGTRIDSLPEFESDDRDMERVRRGCIEVSVDSEFGLFLVLLLTFPDGEFSAGDFPFDEDSKK